MKKITLLVPIFFAFILSACLEPDLPKCNDKDVISVLGKIINGFLKENGEELYFISNKNTIEKGFNKEKKIRVCFTEVMISDSSEEELIYNIKWINEKKGLYEVNIVD